MPSLAIIIGVDRYEPEINRLEGAVGDAHDIALWLLQSRLVVPSELQLGLHRHEDSPPLPDELMACPTFEPSLDGLDDLLTVLLKDLPQLDRLIFAYSGHGAASSNSVYDAEALCLAGFTAQKWQRALELQSLLQTLRAFPAAERFVWIDGCRNEVTNEAAQFGRLGVAPPRDEAVLREYILRATPLGRKAAETGKRGLFTRYLVEGLKGAGAAKRWDPVLFDGNGGYAVRWNALADYVTEAVAQLPAAQRREQLVSRSGESTGNTDPLLASFQANAFAKEEVEFTVVGGAQATATLHGRRDQHIDVVQEIMTAGVALTVAVPPSGWTFHVQSPGHHSTPLYRAFAVYGPGLSGAFELVRDEPDRSGAENAPGPTGIRISVAGRPVEELMPQPRIAVLQDSGAVVQTILFKSEIELEPGLYRVRIEAAGGQATQVSVPVVDGAMSPVQLPAPERVDEGAANLLARLGKPTLGDGFALPSEAAGELLGVSLATTALLAAGRRIIDAGGSLLQLQLNLNGIEGAWSGLAVLLTDSRMNGKSDLPRARLWRMRTTNDGAAVDLRQSGAEEAIASGARDVERGYWWLQLRDENRDQRRGFKLATAVFPDHATIVLRDRLAEGGVAILQFAVRQAPADLRAALQNLARAEDLQRALGAGRSPLADPQVAGLAAGAWFEPFSALVAGSALLDSGKAGSQLLQQLLARITDQGLDGPDVAMLRAGAAEDMDYQRTMAQDVLGMKAAPIIDRLLARLDITSQRFGLFGKEQRWLAEKRKQSVGHRIWTLRREDDERRSGKPDVE